MILLVLLASVLIAGVTIIQYDEQTKEYNEKRFERKEAATKQDIQIELTRRTTFPVNTKNLEYIFQNRIYEISQVHKLSITMYNMNGAIYVFEPFISWHWKFNY